jgi:hypothetical protein
MQARFCGEVIHVAESVTRASKRACDTAGRWRHPVTLQRIRALKTGDIPQFAGSSGP